MRLAVLTLAITVMASAIAMAFNYAHRPSYAAPNHAQQELDANGNSVVRVAKAPASFSTRANPMRRGR